MRAVRAPVDEAVERDRLWEGVQNLSLEQKVLVVSQYHDGFTEAETAELTASTVATVQSQTDEVLEALRHHCGQSQRLTWREALEDAVRPDAASAEPADRLARLLREMFDERADEVRLPTGWGEQTLRRARLVRHSRVIAPVAAAALLVAVVVGATGLVGSGIGTTEKPSATATETDGLQADLAHLPIGPPPDVPYAVGRTIVLAPDQRVELPNTYHWNGPFGMGGTTDGLLVVPRWNDDRGTAALHVAKGGTVTELDTPLGWYGSHVISPDGRYAAWTTRIGVFDEPVFAHVADLRTGEIIASRRLPDELSVPTTDFRVPRIHAFDGNEVLVVGYHPAGELTYARWTLADRRLDFRQGPPGLKSAWSSSLAADTLVATVEDNGGNACLVNIAVSNPDLER